MLDFVKVLFYSNKVAELFALPVINRLYPSAHFALILSFIARLLSK